jgi:hypothetical protein
MLTYPTAWLIQAKNSPIISRIYPLHTILYQSGCSMTMTEINSVRREMCVLDAGVHTIREIQGPANERNNLPQLKSRGSK